jgi:hypothetical protein
MMAAKNRNGTEQQAGFSTGWPFGAVGNGFSFAGLWFFPCRLRAGEENTHHASDFLWKR